MTVTSPVGAYSEDERDMPALELYQAGRTRRVCTEANANESAASMVLKLLPRTCTKETSSSKTLLRAPSRTRQLAFFLR